MTSPILSLRAALRGILLGNTTLLTLLGGERIYDETPATADTPYVTFGEASADDWSTGTERGHDQTLSLNVWSRQGGDSEALAIASLIAALLDGSRPVLDGHRLIVLRVTDQSIGRPSKDGLRRASIKLSALTEFEI